MVPGTGGCRIWRYEARVSMGMPVRWQYAAISMETLPHRLGGVRGTDQRHPTSRRVRFLAAATMISLWTASTEITPCDRKVGIALWKLVPGGFDSGGMRILVSDGAVNRSC